MGSKELGYRTAEGIVMVNDIITLTVKIYACMSITYGNNDASPAYSDVM